MKNRHASQAPWALSTLLLFVGLACAKRPVDYEREYAKTLAPKQLQTSAPSASGPQRTLRVRVYADADYRKQVIHWQSGIEEQLRRASAVVQGPLGVTFTVDSARPWERPASGPELDTALRQLEALDAGEDVDLVIGLVSALPVFSASQHELGKARMLGRHCVLRGMENPQEHQNLMAVLSHLPDSERDALYRDRKLHKETSVLLHEWAHTLGAFHVQDSHWMMSPAYESTQAAFAPQTLQLLTVSLRHVPQGRRDTEAQKAWARELKETLTATVWPEWEGPEKQGVLDWTERVLAGHEPLGPRTAPPLSAEDRQRLEAVLALDKQGRVEMAAQQLEPLAQRHPRNAQVQVLACYLALRTAPKLPSTRERCETAAERFPDEPALALNVALLQLQNGKAADAQASLLKLRQRLEADGSTDAGLWADLAGGFQNASCVTWAEQAAAKGAGTEHAAKVLAWATQTRRWMALPADAGKSGVGPEREGDFIRAVRDAEAQFDTGTVAQAKARMAWLGKEFPRAAALHVLQCELHLRSGQVAPARAECQKAVAAQDDAVQAHFILGMLAAQTRARQEARTHLERVIALEPAHAEAWKLLAEQYRADGQAEALRGLQQRYRARFSQDLP